MSTRKIISPARRAKHELRASCRRARVYLASPLSTYETPRYERMCALAAAQFPGAEILEARSLYSSHQEWRERWPLVLPTLSALVFFSDEEGYIGSGVAQEIEDARALKIDVLGLSDTGVLHSLDCMAFGERDHLNWRRHIRITYQPHRVR